MYKIHVLDIEQVSLWRSLYNYLDKQVVEEPNQRPEDQTEQPLPRNDKVHISVSNSSERAQPTSTNLSADHQGNAGSPTATSKSDAAPLNQPQQKKRRKVVSACVYCRRSHMNCDESRPCKRCVKRNIGHLCHDSHSKPPSLIVGQSNSPSLIGDSSQLQSSGLNHQQQQQQQQQQQLQHQKQTLPYTNNYQHHQYQSQNSQFQYSANHPPQQHLNSQSQFFNSNPSSATLTQQPFFYSEHAGSEFNSLTEFLSMIDDNDMMDSININNDPMLQKLEATNYFRAISSNNLANLGTPNPEASKLNLQQYQPLHAQPSHQQHLTNNHSMDSSSQPAEFINSLPQIPLQHQNPPVLPSTKNPMSINQSSAYLASTIRPPSIIDTFPSQSNSIQQQSTTPRISDAARDKFFLTAADPTTEISPEERLKQVINAKLEAGLLKPYNYAQGYQRLQNYMDKYMAASSRARILKPLSTFRPGFRAIAKTLKDIDLILVEESLKKWKTNHI
ncbi:Regulator of drug sensitivity 2 [Pichia kudriavzevii]|uniref:Regulator of drug sensitivity 2 n=1 Tax=Pichia kudriavzevii TaxID=4909 RepID=A0A1V2LIY0_PICKU|nr:Regulator of drug sensitivity 2 [Pichia kudriavzevii]